MAKHIAPPATFEQLTESLGLTPEEIKFLERIVDEVLEEEEEEEKASRPSHGRGEEDILQAKKETKP